MLPIVMTITSAGLDALVDAQNGVTEAITITQVGLSETAIDPAPTIDALPGEIKRIDLTHGQAVAPNMIHITGQDPSTDTYELRSLALYLADGTLFGVYGQADPIFSKVSIATFLFAQDVAFSSDIAGAIAFGDANFLYPPATETEKGVAEIATQAEVDGEVDDARIVTPLKLAVRLAALLGGINGDLAAEVAARIAGDDDLQTLVDALTARTITGAGLATGGGDLSADRVLTVTEASAAEVAAGTDATHVLTPRRAAVLLPAGAVFAFAMNAAPAGYLECNGAAVSRADYAALFAAIGTTHGAGDGATTFNLPDLRGEFVRGWDHGRGADAGRAFGSAQADDFKSHSHTISGGSGGGAQLEAGSGGATTTVNTGLTGGGETRPRNIALLYAIKT